MLWNTREHREDWTSEQWAEFHAKQREQALAHVPKAVKASRRVAADASRIRAGLPVLRDVR